MKRMLVVILLFMSGILATYGDYVYWTTVGGRYSAMDEMTSAPAKSRAATMSSLDVLLEYYEFYDERRIGFFYHDAFLLPSSGSLAIAGKTISSDLSAYDFLLGAEIAVGPAFRVPIARDANIVIGIGPLAAKMTGWTASGVNQQFNFGYALGMLGAVGLKFDLLEGFFIKFGFSLGYYFANYSEASTYGNANTGWANSYSTFSLSPYIGVGVNNYVKQTKVKSRFSWL